MRLLSALAALAFTVLWGPTAQAAGMLHVYGPGGPAPAIKEAAQRFQEKSGVKVEVVSGPTKEWLEKAKGDADVVYSGSETMMSDFLVALDGVLAPQSVKPLYLRGAAILVRKGNPGKIRGLESLFAPGHRVLVVNGAGQNGLWEDMAGRTGEISKVRALRGNIVTVATTSAEAKAKWTSDQTLDAWIIWDIWQVANRDLADQVKVEPVYQIYRDAGVGLTQKALFDPNAAAFVAYLASDDGAKVFAKWGWRAR